MAVITSYRPEQKAEGRKDDSSKIMAGILYQDFPNALLNIAEVASFGARKYDRHNWRHVPDGETRYTDAFHRHLLLHSAGESRDSESELLHLSHAAWNLLALLEMKLKQQEK